MLSILQDAGLIFLSAMSNNIADSILKGGGTVEEVCFCITHKLCMDVCLQNN